MGLKKEKNTLFAPPSPSLPLYHCSVNNRVEKKRERENEQIKKKGVADEEIGLEANAQ